MIRALLLTAFLAAPAFAQDRNRVETGDCSPVIIGSGSTQIVECGITFEQHEAALDKRVAELTALHDKLVAEIRSGSEAKQEALRLKLQLTETQLQEFKRRAANPEQSYKDLQAKIAELERLIADSGAEIGEQRLRDAQAALARGDFTLADDIFAEVQERERRAVERLAEAAYGRGLIAEEQVRWLDAADHFARAARHAPNGDNLHKAKEYAWRAGRYQAAYRHGEDYLAFVLREHGEGTPQHATALTDLGTMLRSLGQYDDAEPFYRKAADIYKATLGPEHPFYAISLNNLAELLRATGRYAEAEPLYRQSLEIVKATLGEAHPEYATRLNNLAGLLRATGRYAEAEPLYRQALEIGKATIGEAHPDYATRLNNLAGLLRATGRYAEAEPLHRQALEIRKAAPGRRIRTMRRASTISPICCGPRAAMRRPSRSPPGPRDPQDGARGGASGLCAPASTISPVCSGSRGRRRRRARFSNRRWPPTSPRSGRSMWTTTPPSGGPRISPPGMATRIWPPPATRRRWRVSSARSGRSIRSTKTLAGQYAGFLSRTGRDPDTLAKLREVFGPDIGR